MITPHEQAIHERLKDLVRTLAQGHHVSWYDYTTDEMLTFVLSGLVNYSDHGTHFVLTKRGHQYAEELGDPE